MTCTRPASGWCELPADPGITVCANPEAEEMVSSATRAMRQKIDGDDPHYCADLYDPIKFDSCSAHILFLQLQELRLRTVLPSVH